MPEVVWSITFNEHTQLPIFNPAKESPVTVRKKPLPGIENCCRIPTRSIARAVTNKAMCFPLQYLSVASGSQTTPLEPLGYLMIAEESDEMTKGAV